MLETGYTRVGEFHYLHNDIDGRRYADPAATAASIVAAADESGIGLTLLPVFYAHADFGGAPPTPGQRRFVSDIDCFARLVEASRALLPHDATIGIRSEEHTSELQSIMRISYAVLCLQKKIHTQNQ